MKNNNNLNELPYAKWLEENLQNIVGTPVDSICILTKYDDGALLTSFYECSMADKLCFAGYLQQDATIDALKINGLVKNDEDDNEE